MAVFYAGMLAGALLAFVLWLMAVEFFIAHSDPEDFE